MVEQIENDELRVGKDWADGDGHLLKKCRYRTLKRIKLMVTGNFIKKKNSSVTLNRSQKESNKTVH